jgi:hypothetical protein
MGREEGSSRGGPHTQEALKRGRPSVLILGGTGATWPLLSPFLPSLKKPSWQFQGQSRMLESPRVG